MFLVVPRTIQLAVLQLYLCMSLLYVHVPQYTHLEASQTPFSSIPLLHFNKITCENPRPLPLLSCAPLLYQPENENEQSSPPHYSTTSTTSLQEKDPTLCIHHSTTHHLHHRRAKPAPPPPTALPVVILGVSKKALLLRVQYFQANIVQRIYFCCYFAPFQLCLSRTLSAQYFIFRQYFLQNTFIQRCMHGLYLYLVRVISSLPLYYLKCSYPPWFHHHFACHHTFLST